MRMIDADALTKKYCKQPAKGDCKNCDWYGDSWCRGEIFGVQIAEFPTVDAEPVVHCKDCKHMKLNSGMRFCNVWVAFNGAGDDGFCNYGERRATDEQS